MFQAADLGRWLSKTDFEAELPSLRANLLQGLGVFSAFKCIEKVMNKSKSPYA